MDKRFFNFSKGPGIFFALAAGIDTAVLGYLDRTDWIHVVDYSLTLVAIVLLCLTHFFIMWSYGLSSTKKDLEKSNDGLEEQKRSLFFELVSKNWIVVVGFLLLLAIFIMLCFLVPGFFSGRTKVAAVIFLGFLILAFVAYKFLHINKSVIIGVSVFIGLFII